MNAEQLAKQAYPDTATERWVFSGPHPFESHKWQKEQEEIERDRRCFLAGYSAAHQWVDVKKELPSEGQDVMVFIYDDSERIRIGYVSEDNRWFLISGAQIFPTHWLPLPPLPTTK